MISTSNRNTGLTQEVPQEFKHSLSPTVRPSEKMETKTEEILPHVNKCYLEIV